MSDNKSLQDDWNDTAAPICDSCEVHLDGSIVCDPAHEGCPVRSEGHEESCGHPNHGNPDHDCAPFRRCDNPECACNRIAREAEANRPRPLALRCPHCSDRITPVLEYTTVSYSEHRDHEGYECENWQCDARWDKFGDPTQPSKLLPESCKATS